eukprot:564612-Pyramimonas_sp.AAC.1
MRSDSSSLRSKSVRPERGGHGRVDPQRNRAGMFREVSRGMFRLRPAPGRVLYSDSSGLRSKSVQPGFGGHGRVDPQRT